MMRQLLWLVLGLSVLFNVFFLAGYMRARWQLADPPALRTNMTDELRLDDGQAAIFGHLRNDLEEDNRLFLERLSLVQQQIFSEMNRADPDTERIQSLMEQDGELRHQMQQAAHERFRAFLGMLSPEQRQRLTRRLDQGRHDGQRRRMILRRFDRNQDGRLDETEQSTAREFMEHRQHERKQRREQVLERFDVNHDGELDATERAVMQRWFEANRDRSDDEL